MRMQDPLYDIHKAAAVIIEDGTVLLTRAKGKGVFVPPGGKLEPSETALEACVRELHEELDIAVAQADLELLGTFYDIAAGTEATQLRMDVFLVHAYTGAIACASEIEEIARVGATIPQSMQVGSIFEHHILPLLLQQGFVR